MSLAKALESFLDIFLLYISEKKKYSLHSEGIGVTILADCWIKLVLFLLDFGETLAEFTLKELFL